MNRLLTLVKQTIAILGAVYGVTTSLLLEAQDISDCKDNSFTILESIVKVHYDNSSWSSAVVINHNLVLTVAHGIAQDKQIFATISVTDGISSLPRQYVHPAEVVAIHHGLDLALLYVTTHNIPPIAFASSKLITGAPVIAAGFISQTNKQVTTGEIIRDRWGRVESSAPIAPGESGGPLMICENNKLVIAGILRAFIANPQSSLSPYNSGLSVASSAMEAELFVKQFHQQYQSHLAQH